MLSAKITLPHIWSKLKILANSEARSKRWVLYTRTR
jgi:hypothetical protein